MRALTITSALLLLTLGLGACSIEGVTFAVGAIDSNTGNDDASGESLNFVVSSSSMTVTEGMTRELMVSVTSAPPGALLVTLEASDDTRLGVTPAALLFSTADWSMPQAVSITGKPDADISDENLELTLHSTAIASPMVVAVTVDDDDGLALAIRPSTLDVTEGGTGTLSVALTAMPSTTITVNVASSDSGVATVPPSTLVFTPANYANEQSLTIAGAQDANIVTNTATIDFTSPDLTATSVTVQVSDDDVLGISPSTSSISLQEGASRTFTVVLTQQPPADVSVALSANASVATVTPTPLTFTTTSWNTPQTLTVTAVDDDNVANGSTTITLTATGLDTRSIAVSVTDDDTQAIVTTPATPLAVTEGATAQLGVRLAFRPEADVVVAAGSMALGVATVSPANLTFSPSNYSTSQNIGVSGTQDADTTNASTTVRLDAATLGLTKDVTVNVIDNDVTLTVTKAGTGTGTVTSSPAGINCGADCNENYDLNTSVTLTAAAATGSTFASWGGACSGVTATCVVTMSQVRNVTATFTIITYGLTVTKGGTGSGTVSSNPPGISCGPDCSESYNYNTSVILTASATTGSTFTGWSGACTGMTSTCTVTMSQAHSVTASFTLNTYALTVARTGTGSGTVASNPMGISCGTDCTENYNYNTAVTLTASASTGSTFTGWSGDCTGAASTCTVTMIQARGVTATFTVNTYALTVTVTEPTGPGPKGTVTSTPAGIDCGVDCSQSYDYNTSVTLSASAAIGYAFERWEGTGGCSGIAPTCTVTMTTARDVTAKFRETFDCGDGVCTYGENYDCTCGSMCPCF